jgi:hypothetical protein
MVVAVCVLALAAAANGSILVQDDFSTPGNLVGTAADVGGTWAAHSAAGVTPVVVTAGQATVAQGAGSREDVNVTFAGGEVASAGKKYYAAFTLKVTGADPVGSVYFAHFSDTGTATFTSRIGVTDAAADYKLGIFTGSTAVGATYPTELAFNTTHRVVVSYAYDTGVSEMWVDPVASLGENDPGQAAKISATVTNDLNKAIKAFAFRQATVPTGTQASTQVVDDLVVATSFAEAVPEPATLVLLSLGTVALLRRR